MSSESISDRREHLRSIGVTAFAALLGVGAAVASAVITGTSELTSEDALSAAAVDSTAYLIVLAAIVIQFPILKARVYGEDEFGIKHYLFITFMTFSFWYVTWGVLLTAQYSQV